jgi:3-hydroxybutyryl-CoA dehydratase
LKVVEPEAQPLQDSIPLAGRGEYWQDLVLGRKQRTFRRTVTETDLINFVSVTGMQEAIFIDVDHAGVLGGRVVPAALTYTFIEGFILQNMIRGVGLALLRVSMEAHLPVRIGDTIWAIVELTGLRPTSSNNRAIVTTAVTILNQLNQTVLTYEVTRMLAGDPAKAGSHG